jgi:glucose-6-phosphate isomerase
MISETPEWLDLVSHVQDIEATHLKNLLQDGDRTDMLSMESDGVYADFSRQRVTKETVEVTPPAPLVPGKILSALHAA